MDITPRQILLKDELVRELNMKEYIQSVYENTINDVPKLIGENAEEAQRRKISYLNLRWFMQTLLDRMDRMGMYAGLEARVPFADHRIIEYMWNVPWNMKCSNGVVKGLLRDATKDLLPDEIANRKKSPYPKTYNPEYDKILIKRLADVVNEPNSPINAFVDCKKLQAFVSSPLDYSKPWYGQLMAGPQLIAYMLQVNYWLEKYKINII